MLNKDARSAELKSMPVVGNAVAFARDPLEFFNRMQSRREPILRQKLFGQDFFLIYEPEMIEHVLVRNAKNYVKNKFLKSWDLYFGQGLLTADGEVWKHDRRVIQPLFHRTRIASYAKDISDCALGRVENIRPGESLAINRVMNALTLEIFMSSFLGLELGDQTEKRIAAAFDVCIKYFYFTANPAGILIGNLPTPIRSKYERAVQDLESLLRGIVASKRALGEERLSKRSDLISVLLLAKDDEGRSLSDRQIRDQLMTFLQAGHETTALTLTYAIYLISKNPEIQEKLAEEVSPFKHRAVGADEMDAFPFLKQVTLEALRLYPSSWMVGRDAVEEDSISGWRIPQGSSVIVPVWSMHRDARVFADPEAFRPERWTEEFQKGLHRTRYMPFGYGPRMCIGFGLAQLELQIILGTIYSRKRTSLAAGKPLKVMASVTARPKNDVMIRFDDLV